MRMNHEGRVGAPATSFSPGAPHHPSPYSSSTRRRPSPPDSPTSGSNGRNKHYYMKPPTYREPLFCCCYNCSTPTSLYASIGICCLVLAYTIMGAFTFMALEGGGFSDVIPSSVAASKPSSSRLDMVIGADIRSRTVDKLWSITEDLNILYKENWTRLAAQEVMEFQDSLVRALRITSSQGGYLSRQSGVVYYQTHRWTFSSSFLYSLTLITTIGYGSVAPRTPLGKLTTIIYAVIGIPLMLVYLSTMGEVLARSFRNLYGRLCGTTSRQDLKRMNGSSGCNRKTPHSAVTSGNPHNNHQTSPIDSKLSHYYKDGGAGVILNCGSEMFTSSTNEQSRNNPKNRFHVSSQQTVPVSLCICIIIVYILVGAVLFTHLESWTLLEGSYFCFTSLGTIGFGDLIPGDGGSAAEEVSHCVCSAYILVGMALMAMCFNLVEEEITLIIKSMSRLCGGSEHKMRGSYHHREFYSHHHHHHYHADGCEEISMAVVS